MPAFVICGKRTFLGGDDLRVYTVFAFALRILQLIAIIAFTRIVAVPSKNIKSDPNCPYHGLEGVVDHTHLVVNLYIAFAYVLTLMGMAIEIGIWRTSGRGTPTEQEARKRLKPLCMAKMVPMSFLRVITLALGMLCLVVVRRFCGCGTTDYTTKCPLYNKYIVWFPIIWITHTIEMCVVALYGIYFGLKSKPRITPKMDSEKKWKICCQACCTASSVLTCCLAGGRDASGSDFAEVALVLAEFFDCSGIVDVVISDIMVGFRMLARVQEKRRVECREETIRRCSIQVANCSVVKGDEEMGEAMQSAAEEVQKDTEGELEEVHISTTEDDDVDLDLAKLVVNESQTEPEESGKSKKASHYADRRAMLKRQQGIRALVYQMYRKSGKVYWRPTQRVVLSRRDPDDKMAIAQGARFMRYALAIYCFKSYEYQGHLRFEPFRNKRDEVAGTRAHQSRLMASAGLDNCEIVYAHLKQGLAMTPYAICIDHAWKSVVITIRGTMSLDDAVADLSMRPESMVETGKQCGFDGSESYVHAGMLRCTQWIYNDIHIQSHGVLEKLYSEENSRVAGYQLILTGHSLGAGAASILSFLMKSKYPDLKCLAFSVPGCTMSENMAESCKDYLTSYVLDTDIVPRMSLESLEHLRNDIYEMVARIKVPKIEANRAKPGVEEVDRLLHHKEDVPDSKFTEGLDEFHILTEKRKSERALIHIPLYPPGKIVHLVKTAKETKAGWCCFGGTAEKEEKELLPYAARWAQREDFAEIEISSHFMDDHSSPNVLNELERVAELFELSPPYTVDSTDANKDETFDDGAD